MHFFLSLKWWQSRIIWSVLCRFHSLYHCCHLLSLISIRCHSLSLVVPLVVPLVVIRCHSLYHSLSLVLIRCHSLSPDVPLVCRFLNEINYAKPCIIYNANKRKPGTCFSNILILSSSCEFSLPVGLLWCDVMWCVCVCVCVNNRDVENKGK